MKTQNKNSIFLLMLFASLAFPCSETHAQIFKPIEFKPNNMFLKLNPTKEWWNPPKTMIAPPKKWIPKASWDWQTPIRPIVQNFGRLYLENKTNRHIRVAILATPHNHAEHTVHSWWTLRPGQRVYALDYRAIEGIYAETIDHGPRRWWGGDEGWPVNQLNNYQAVSFGATDRRAFSSNPHNLPFRLWEVDGVRTWKTGATYTFTGGGR